MLHFKNLDYFPEQENENKNKINKLKMIENSISDFFVKKELKTFKQATPPKI